MNRTTDNYADLNKEQKKEELLHLGIVIKNTTEANQAVFLFKRENIPNGVIVSPAYSNAWIASDEMASEFRSASYICKSVYIENKSRNFKAKEHIYMVCHSSDIFGRSGTVNLDYCGSLALRSHQAQKNKILSQLADGGIFIDRHTTLEIRIPAKTEYVLFLDLTSNRYEGKTTKEEIE